MGTWIPLIGAWMPLMGASGLESQTERRALETKPIWERALAEILEVKEHVSALEQSSNQMVRKIDVLGKDRLTMRADQTGLEYRPDKLESKPVS